MMPYSTPQRYAAEFPVDMTTFTVAQLAEAVVAWAVCGWLLSKRDATVEPERSTSA